MRFLFNDITTEFSKACEHLYIFPIIYLKWDFTYIDDIYFEWRVQYNTRDDTSTSIPIPRNPGKIKFNFHHDEL